MPAFSPPPLFTAAVALVLLPIFFQQHVEHELTPCAGTIPDGALVHVRGYFSALPRTDRGVTFEVTHVGGRECTGRVRAHARTLPHDVAGNEVVASAHWWAGTNGSGSLSLDSVRIGAGRRWLLRARLRADAELHRALGATGPLASALMVADMDALDPAVRENFADSGLAHVLAISGAHVAVLAALVLMLARMVHLSETAGATSATIVGVAYVLFLGAPPAAARAAVQSTLALLARVLQRPSDPLAHIAFAAMLLMALDPAVPANVGFQLSFAGMLGLMLWTKPIAAKLRYCPAFLREPLAASLAASAATTPIAALQFGRVAPVGLPAGLIAGPLLALLVPALILVLVLSPLPSLQALILPATDAMLRLLDATARVAAAVPGGHTVVPQHSTVVLLLCTVVCMLALRGMRAPVIAGVIVACVLFVSVLYRHVGDALEIHAIDVGQGDAIAIHTPDDRWILVDAGPRDDRFDAGRRRVVPFLQRHGAGRLDALILTHPHADHIGGALSVLRAVPPQLVIDPGVRYAAPMYSALLDSARAQQRRWIAARTGRELDFGDVRLTFLNRGDEPAADPDDANEFSVAFRLTYGSFAAVFLGDAPADVERRIVARSGAMLRAQVLKVAHHGSATSSDPALLAAVQPRVALISLGRRNRYGHPAPATLSRLRGVQVLRTDQLGTITVQAKPDGTFGIRTER